MPDADKVSLQLQMGRPIWLHCLGMHVNKDWVLGTDAPYPLRALYG